MDVIVAQMVIHWFHQELDAQLGALWLVMRIELSSE